MAMIFQEPMTSLNPVLTIGQQIAEAILRAHARCRREAAQRARDRDAGAGAAFPSAAQRIDDYPHQLSGGMRQRVMIAMALSCEPGAADRRRADHRARRHHPGADPRPAARPAAPARHGDPDHHPRSRRDRRDRRPGAGDVCRPRRREAPMSPTCSPTRSIPTRIGLLGSIPRLDVRPRAARHHRGHGARARTACRTGCRFAPRCPFADRALPARAAAAARHRRPAIAVACWKAPVEAGAA